MRLLAAAERIPIWVRIAVLAVAVAAIAAVTLIHDDDSDSNNGVEGATGPSAYLGPKSGGHGWIRSRPKRTSFVWAVGDAADGGPESRAVSGMVTAHRVDRFLYLGDVYETGTASEFASNYDPIYGSIAFKTAPTIGNHEWPNIATGYVPYWTGKRGTPPPLWYAFAASGWQLISLNTNASGATLTDQAGWLNRTIADSPRFGDCRIAFSHHPFFSAGLHGDTPGLQPLFDALKGHTTIALSGHDHDMERLRPVDGITQLVDGAGGNELYPVNSDDPRLAFADSSHHGALRITLTPGHAVLSFFDSGGALLDRSTLTCQQK